MASLSARDASILDVIVSHCDSISSRINRYGVDREVFEGNADYREMILFPLIQIGELANHLSKEFLDIIAHPGRPLIAFTERFAPFEIS